MSKVFTLIGGCNGAGKSTYASRFLSDSDYINPDALQAEQGVGAFEIGRFVVGLVDDKLRGMESFTLESTFSDRRGLSLFRQAKLAGWETRLIFIGLDSPSLHKERVALRVSKGGHDIAEDLIERRYPRALENLKAALPMVDEVLVLDNSGTDYRKIALFKGAIVSHVFPHGEASGDFSEFVGKLVDDPG